MNNRNIIIVIAYVIVLSLWFTTSNTIFTAGGGVLKSQWGSASITIISFLM